MIFTINLKTIKMNTQVNILAIVLVLIIFLPIYFLNRTGLSFSKRLAKNFDTLAKNNNLKLDQKECWSNTCIGIDTTQKKLLYNRGLETDSFIIINLNDINSCEQVKHVSEKKINKMIVYELTTLDLKFYLKNNKPSITLNFYDIENSFIEDFELNRIEKWKLIINANLNHDSIKKVA